MTTTNGASDHNGIDFGVSLSLITSQAYPQFRMAFKESTACFTPNGFSSLQRQLKDESRGLGLRPALALLRLSQFDPDVFYKFKQASEGGVSPCRPLHEVLNKIVGIMSECTDSVGADHRDGSVHVEWNLAPKFKHHEFTRVNRRLSGVTQVGWGHLRLQPWFVSAPAVVS